MRSSRVMGLCLVMCLSIFAGGCASITGTAIQSVSLQSRDNAGREVPGAACELTNNKGKWFATTPGSVSITRSNDDMQVICAKAGYEPGRAAVVSATKGSMFGNIIFGGGIGAIVDHNTGAAYEYPSFFQVVMGAFTRIEPPPQDAQGQSPPPAGTQGSAGAPPPAASLQASPQPARADAQATQSKVASTAQPPAPNAPAAESGRSLEDRLAELKRLFDTGLITQDVYVERQRVLLSR